MGRLRNVLLGSVLALAMQPMTGCTRLFKLSPVVDEQTDRIFIAGDEWAVVEDAYARVAVSGEKLSGSEIHFAVSVINKSNTRFDLIPEDIRVSTGGERSGRQLKVWSPDRFMSDRSSGQAMGMALDSFARALSTPDAGKKTVTSTKTGSAAVQSYGTDSSYRRERYSERTTTIVDDPAARLAAEEQERRRIAEKQADFDASNSRLDASLLRSTTLFKGDKAQGVVIVQAEDSPRYLVTVPLGDRTYKVRFTPKD